MALEICKYPLSQFKSIITSGVDYIIPLETMDKINKISTQVGCPQYIKTPVFKKEAINAPLEMFRNKSKKLKKNIESSDDDWHTPTQPTKNHGKNIDSIMTLLNKLTSKNSEPSLEQLDIVLTSLTKENDDFDKIGNLIFDVLSSNIFYSLTYATVFTSLVNKYDWIKTIFDTKFNTYLETFDNIESGDPDVDYDHFCNINKINTKRKSQSAFVLNLMDTKVMTEIQVKDILKQLTCKMNNLIQEENRKKDVDELMENIAIMYRKTLADDAHAELGLITIHEFIQQISKSKVSQYKSLTNKSVFKCMDIMESNK